MKMTNISNHTETTTDKEKSRSENNSKIIIKNDLQLKIDIIQVDRGVYPKSDTSTNRCDILINCASKDASHFVEFKSGNIKNAPTQLAASIKDPLLPKHVNKFAYIISSNVDSTTAQAIKKSFYTNNKVKLIIKCTQYTLVI